MAQLVSENALPASVRAERTILGAMLVDAESASEALGALLPEDLHLDTHRRIFRAMQAVAELGQSVDIITVAERLRAQLEMNTIGGTAYLASLSENLPRKLSIESYVAIVREKALLRELAGLHQLGFDRAVDPGAVGLEVLADAHAALMAVEDRGVSSGFADVATIVRESFGSIDALYEQRGEVTGLASGYADLDAMLSGLQRSELIILAARPSMGKTALGMNIAQNVAERAEANGGRAVVAVFSLEMSKEALLRRMLSGGARVNARALQQGFISREDRARLNASLERLLETSLVIDDEARTLLAMRAQLRQLRAQRGRLDLVLVDYLQLMDGRAGGRREAENRTAEVTAISGGLKALAKEFAVPVVALAQLSRDVEKRGGAKKPLLSDLRDSGSIEQDADVVLFIHREGYYDREDPELERQAEVIVAKQRNGPCGSVRLVFHKEFTRFESWTEG